MKMLACCLLAAIFIMSGGAQAGEGIRLHVIGETDWHTDQAYKLIVRDRALELIENGEADIEASLNDMAEAAGRPRSITVEQGVFHCPSAEKDGREYPAGDYNVMRIRIGRAEGCNWWGMLYPDQAGLGDDMVYYSAIVDWLLGIFGLE